MFSVLKGRDRRRDSGCVRLFGFAHHRFASFPLRSGSSLSARLQKYRLQGQRRRLEALRPLVLAS